MAQEANGNAANGSTAGAPSQEAAQPVTPTTNAPSGFQVPQGQRLVSDEDFNRMSRYEQQVKGMSGYYEAGRKLGFQSPDDFGKWTPAFDAIKKQGHTPEFLARAFGGQQVVEQPGQKEEAPKYDPAEISRIVDARVSRLQSETMHASAEEAASKSILGIASELMGPKAKDTDRKLLVKAIRGELSENPKLYPDGHPLAKEKFAPPTDEEIRTIAKSLLGIDTKSEAAALVKEADKLRDSRNKFTPSVAGNSGGQGSPQQNPKGKFDLKAAVSETMARFSGS